jgi:hypothetical protein
MAGGADSTAKLQTFFVWRAPVGVSTDTDDISTITGL